MTASVKQLKIDDIDPALILAAHRFNETTEDGQEYDVAPKLMSRLNEIGLVEHKGRSFYMQTDLMLELQDQLKLKAGQICLDETRGTIKLGSYDVLPSEVKVIYPE